jgi:hypothetical protein
MGICDDALAQAGSASVLRALRSLLSGKFNPVRQWRKLTRCLQEEMRVMKIIVFSAIALQLLAGLPSAAGTFDTRTFWEQQKQFGR